MEHEFFQLSYHGHLFSFFYSAAFLAALGMLLLEGYRRKFPMVSWILIVSFSQILFIAGTRFFALSPAEWGEMIRHFVLPESSKKELFGGVFLLMAGVWAGKRWLHFRPPVADAFALAIPLGLVFQKAGCFFAGCCFGKVSHLPWAVEYPVMTLPHFHHYQESLIGSTDLFSLPVHPAQLYELAGALLVVILVVAREKKWRCNGSSLLFSAALFLGVRFLVEFARDPLAHTTGGAMWGWLNQTQWAVLVVVPVILYFLVTRERSTAPQVPSALQHQALWRPSSGPERPQGDNPLPANIPSGPALVSLFCFSALLFIALSGWFRMVETTVILLFSGVAALMAIPCILKRYRRKMVRMLYAGLLLLPLILMGQTFPEQVRDSVRIRKTISLGLGVGTGSFNNSVEHTMGEGCDRVTNTAYFKQKYTTPGVGVQFRTENLTRASEVSYGLDFWLGNHTEKLLKTTISPEDSLGGPGAPLASDQTFIFGVHPYVEYQERWYGVGGGFHVGRMTYAWYDRELERYGMPRTGHREYSLYPQLWLRFGPRDVAFAEYRLASHFPSPFPGYLQMVGLGTGLGKMDGVTLRIGTLIGDQYNNEDWDFEEASLNGFYTSGYFPLKGGWVLEPLFLITPSVEDSRMGLQMSVGMRYLLNRKEYSRAAAKTEKAVPLAP